MKKPCHVERVFVIFKVHEANDQPILSEKERVYILRICAVRQRIILEKWSDFKKYCQNKFTDLIYRNLNVDRTALYLKTAKAFVEGIIKQPFVVQKCMETR